MEQNKSNIFFLAMKMLTLSNSSSLIGIEFNVDRQRHGTVNLIRCHPALQTRTVNQ